MSVVRTPFTRFVALTRAREAGRTMVRSPAAPSPFLFSGLLLADSGSGPAERPARAAWAALRLPTAVADSFFVISGSGRRWSSGGRAIDDDVGCDDGGAQPRIRRRARAASYGVIDNDRKFRSTDGRGALAILFAIPRARGGAERRAESGPSIGPRRRPISF